MRVPTLFKFAAAVAALSFAALAPAQNYKPE